MFFTSFSIKQKGQFGLFFGVSIRLFRGFRGSLSESCESQGSRGKAPRADVWEFEMGFGFRVQGLRYRV